MHARVEAVLTGLTFALYLCMQEIIEGEPQAEKVAEGAEESNPDLD